MGSRQDSEDPAGMENRDWRVQGRKQDPKNAYWALPARLWNLEFSEKARDLISGLGRPGRGPSGRGQESKQVAEEVLRPEAAGPYKNSGGQQRARTPRAPATLLRHQWWVQLSSSEFWSHYLILGKLGTERATGTPAAVLALPLTSL